jgi:hypothetical protein
MCGIARVVAVVGQNNARQPPAGALLSGQRSCRTCAVGRWPAGRLLPVAGGRCGFHGVARRGQPFETARSIKLMNRQHCCRAGLEPGKRSLPGCGAAAASEASLLSSTHVGCTVYNGQLQRPSASIGGGGGGPHSSPEIIQRHTGVPKWRGYGVGTNNWSRNSKLAGSSPSFSEPASSVIARAFVRAPCPPSRPAANKN